jgi:hypothetical protein
MVVCLTEDQARLALDGALSEDEAGDCTSYGR